MEVMAAGVAMVDRVVMVPVRLGFVVDVVGKAVQVEEVEWAVELM